MTGLNALLLGFSGAASAGPVTLTAADGAALRATSWGSGTHGVLLVHAEGRSAEDWSSLGEKLGSNGFRVLALTLRGHGRSGQKPDPDAFPRMTADVDAGLAWLGDRGATEIHLVGAELGANLGLTVAERSPAVTDLVLLSPQLNAHGFTISGPIAGYGDRTLLVVASEDDGASAKAAKYLHDKATGHKQLTLYPSAGAGARMLNSAADLENLVLSWVNGTFLQATDPNAAKTADLRSGDMSDIETSGTRIEERDR